MKNIGVVNVQDQFTRRAIWEDYNFRCFYSGNPLDYSEMELDHIIPVSYKNKPLELQNILKECDLDENFEINSLYNLVPTNKFQNNRKSDMEYEPKTILFFLGLVREHVSSIEMRIKKLKKKRNYEEHLSMLKTHFDETDEQVREKLLVDIIGFIGNEDDEFIEQEEVYVKEGQQIFKKYKRSIGLEAIVPEYNNVETECAIYFKTLKTRDCILILDNKTVLSQLFSGIFTDPKYGARGFLEDVPSKKTKQGYINFKNTYVRLGSNKLKLSKDDIYLLCEVIDTYAQKYLELIKNIENVLLTHSFPLSKRLNNYKLITVSYSDWRKLIDFCIKHDVDSGKSDWNIFHRNYHYIKVFTDQNHPKYDWGYHAFFYGEFAEDIVYYPELVSKDICITFEFVEDLDARGIDNINEKRNWNARIAYFWLINELLPKVLGKSQTSRVLTKNKGGRDNFLESNVFERIQYINSKKIIDIKDLSEIISSIQEYFHENPHSKYRINKQNFIGIYNSIILCIKKSKKPDLYYICKKLHLTPCESKLELIDFINGLIESITDTTINGFGIDYLFRALYISLESKGIKLNSEELEYVRNEVSYFIDIRDREVLFKKYALNFQ